MVLRLAHSSAYYRHRTGASERPAEEIPVRQPDHCQGQAAPPKTESSSKTTGVFEAWLHLVPMCYGERATLRIIPGPVNLLKSTPNAQPTPGGRCRSHPQGREASGPAGWGLPKKCSP